MNPWARVNSSVPSEEGEEGEEGEEEKGLGKMGLSVGLFVIERSGGEFAGCRKPGVVLGKTECMGEGMQPDYRQMIGHVEIMVEYVGGASSCT